MDYNITFGDRIKKMRSNKNLLQVELAELLGLSQSAIGAYERNQREPSFSHLLAMSKLFNCSIDYLLCNSNERYSVDQFLKRDKIELTELLNNFNVTYNGVTLDETSKRRILDVTHALLWPALRDNDV